MSLFTDMAAEAIAKKDARIKELEQALQEIMNADIDMGMYPAAIVSLDKEIAYEQRDGFKNGWNAACMEFVNKATAIVFRVYPDVDMNGGASETE
jgi:hypothetical protein